MFILILYRDLCAVVFKGFSYPIVLIRGQFARWRHCQRAASVLLLLVRFAVVMLRCNHLVTRT